MSADLLVWVMKVSSAVTVYLLVLWAAYVVGRWIHVRLTSAVVTSTPVDASSRGDGGE